MEATHGGPPRPRGSGGTAGWRVLSPGRRAQVRLDLVVMASARMADTLDLRAVACGLAETIVTGFADRVSVDLVEALFHPDHPPAGTATVVCRVALAGGPGGPVEDEWLAYPPGSPAAAALASGRPLLDDGVPGAPDALCVPLVARGRVLGLARFARDAGAAAYDNDDLALAEELASRAALALDNVRLYDEARAAAVALQRSLLPTVHPRVTGVSTAQRYLPGSRATEVGGDWFDVIPLSSGRVALVIGDVMGRGLRAAAAMGQLRTAVRTLAVIDPMPEDVLTHLDDLALNIAEVQLATCIYAVFDPVGRELAFATAGHLPPAMRRPGEPATFLPAPSGAPLGVGGVPYESHTVAVPDGARLMLYTDGLVESRQSDIDEGLDQLAEAFTTGPADLDALCDHVLAALGRGNGHDDDVAVLVAELCGLDDARSRSWRLTGEESEVALARRQVREALTGWGLDGLGDTAELLVSELVTNALRYASGPVELQALLLDEVVTFAVCDGDAPLPRLRRSTFEDEGGRGLQLVASLASRWGARATPNGKVVWCELTRPPAALPR